MVGRLWEFIVFIVPFIAQLLFVPWVNSINASVWGLPFFWFWWLLWLVLTPLFTLTAYNIRKSRVGKEGEYK